MSSVLSVKAKEPFSCLLQQPIWYSKDRRIWKQVHVLFAFLKFALLDFPHPTSTEVDIASTDFLVLLPKSLQVLFSRSWNYCFYRSSLYKLAILYKYKLTPVHKYKTSLSQILFTPCHISYEEVLKKSREKVWSVSEPRSIWTDRTPSSGFGKQVTSSGATSRPLLHRLNTTWFQHHSNSTLFVPHIQHSSH